VGVVQAAALVLGLLPVACGSSAEHESASAARTPRVVSASTLGSELVSRLAAMAPDLVVVTGAFEISEDDKRAARLALPDVPRLGFLPFDPDRFWLHDASSVARRLRALVEPLSSPRPPA
jgi:hypothetical protein